jgi:ubiquinone/menaquinone biosynthesis C-methylase UbiE
MRSTPENQNIRTYAKASIVSYYQQLNELQPAEQILLKDLSPSCEMLDIGVGAGRTTKHFYPLTTQYLGIDNSAEMIAACRKRFPKLVETTFQVGDARDMSCFADNQFDVILFSFNGIDYVSQNDRLQILREVYRVGKPGATFCFSSHNLQGFEKLIDWKSQLSFNPITTYTNLVMLGLLRILNPSLSSKALKELSHTIIKDESHNFRLKTYYIRPREQIAQLEQNFSNIQVFSWWNTQELVTEGDRSSNTDMWLYYFCTVKPKSVLQP